MVNSNTTRECCHSMDVIMEPSCPKYYKEYIVSKRTKITIVEQFKESDWITEDLLEEIMFHVPTKADMKQANGSYIKSKDVSENMLRNYSNLAVSLQTIVNWINI